MTPLKTKILLMADSFSRITPHGDFCVYFVPERKDGQCFQKISSCYKKVSYIMTRHFRSKLVHWNESIYCTPSNGALKIRFNEGSGAFNDQPFLSYASFPTINFAVFWLNKYTDIRRFWTIFCHNTWVFSLQKVQKIQFWVQ